MSEVKFSKEHEWITLEGDVATIGITKHATEMLGDIVFVELPEKGSNVEKDGTAGVVESTKSASDVYTPVSGEVMDTNQAIVDDPSKINEDPEGSAWFFRSIFSLFSLSEDAFDSASLTIFSTSLSDRVDAPVIEILCSFPLPLSFAVTLKIPLASISNVTSI